MHKRAIPDLSDLMKEDVDEIENKTIVLGGEDLGGQNNEDGLKEEKAEEDSNEVEMTSEGAFSEETRSSSGSNVDEKDDF